LEARISIVTLGVSDLKRSIEFYRDGLGLPKRDGPDSIAFFETSGTWLGLYPRDDLAEDANVSAQGTGFRGFSLAHNVRSEEAVDELLQAAVNAGATLVKSAQKAAWGGYSGYFADPDDFLWEVAWNPHFWVE
jgi:catechol 2,3-dioxygenase-like lactoylglutathione lyase family enzyme